MKAGQSRIATASGRHALDRQVKIEIVQPKSGQLTDNITKELYIYIFIYIYIRIS